MSKTFFTGSTGYLGSYVLTWLLRSGNDQFALLVRAADDDAAREKLWRSLQLHMEADEFHRHLGRLQFVHGDLTAPQLGMPDDVYRSVAHQTDSILHIAASLNRKSAKACFNTNLRGTLSILKLGRAAADHHGLRRISYVSTVAVAGERSHEVVTEAAAIDWARSDYDPYGRTKKFGEHMVHELLPDVPRTIFRPAIVMGDSRFPDTSQFDMVRAFCMLADLPVLPFAADGRLDIVNADFVGQAIARLHAKDETAHDTYHLSSGTSSLTAREVAGCLAKELGRRTPRFVPALERPFAGVIDAMNALPKGSSGALLGSLLKVFLPYITYDTVFDNTRVTSELGLSPVSFTDYASGLYRFAKRHDFRYPYRPLPPAPKVVQMAPAGAYA